MVYGVLETVFTVNTIPGIKELSGETTTSVHNLHSMFKYGNPKIPVKRRREKPPEISLAVMYKAEEGSNLCAVDKKGLTDPNRPAV